jgi:DNA-binding SARP family transcriptional activator
MSRLDTADVAALTVRVLGAPRAFVGDRELDLGPPQRQALFTALALRAGRPVPVYELVDAVWGQDLPGNPVGGVHTYVAGLRRQLEPSRPRRSPGRFLLSRDAGYLLCIPAGGLDADVFEAQREAGDCARAAGDEPAAEEAFTRALGLFHGAVLAGVPGPFAAFHRARLAERRQTVVEDRLEVILAQGRHREVTADLRALTLEHPLRERPWGLLMLALYRSGRQSEALEAYDRARAVSVEELGLDPGPALRALRQRIVESDPALDPPAAAIAVSSATGRCDLPRDVADFTGRERELAGLAQSVTRRSAAGARSACPVLVVDGMAGVGKTALAVHLAHRLAPRYPGGQLCLDLQAQTPGRPPLSVAAALDWLLRAAGVEGSDIPADEDERAALWRARVPGAGILLLLDNAAAAAQVRPLLPGSGDSLVVVTSRRRLGGLEAAESLSLDVLPSHEAEMLFTAVVGDARAAAEPDATAQVAQLCGRLPLALRIAAARLRHRPAWSVAHFRDRLADQDRRLAELRVEDRGVAVAFASSYRVLEPASQRMFRLLGLVPGPSFDILAAAALSGWTRSEADDALETLIDAHLVEQPTLSVLRLHDLIAVFARQQCDLEETQQARHEAMRRLLDYYMYATDAAEDLIRPSRTDRGPDTPPGVALPVHADRRAALAWLDGERANVIAAAAAAADGGFAEHAWRIPRHLWGYFEARNLWSEWLACNERALHGLKPGADPLGEARTRLALGVCNKELRRYEEAVGHYTAAADLFDRAGSLSGRAGALINLANVHRRLGDYAEGASCLERAQAILAGTEDRFAQAAALNSLGELRREAGQAAESLAPYERALAIAREQGYRPLEAVLLDGFARALHTVGRDDEAFEACRRAVEACAEAEDRYGEALALDLFGHVLVALGRGSESGGFWSSALAIYDELGAPEAAELRARVAARHGGVGPRADG